MLDATSSPVIVSIVNTLETALTPVFLLAGTAGFLNAFVSRFSRISDRVNAISNLIEKEHGINEDRFAQLNYLRIRPLALEIAVLLGTSAGVFTCLAIGRRYWTSRLSRTRIVLALFRCSSVAGLALIAFLFEMIAASQSMLRQIARDQRTRRSLTVESRDT